MRRISAGRARARIYEARTTGVTALVPIRERFPRFADPLDSSPQAELFARLRAAESIDRPLGDDRFIAASSD
ncbi:hypothetical protein [Bradyrhizobium sp. NAS80.1]|uniref:hypothetical protein n=1 Tax=Bradyrhizobium sp. NAS80.1 TaxID=1680159 RepID=UPI001AF027DC|nr:hypothetical protein [Bradyrhizobium sp. NAS80.1]